MRKKIATVVGTAVTASGDAMLVHAAEMTTAGQPDRQTAAMRAEFRLWGRIVTNDRTERQDGNRRGLDSGMISAGQTYRTAVEA